MTPRHLILATAVVAAAMSGAAMCATPVSAAPAPVSVIGTWRIERALDAIEPGARPRKPLDQAVGLTLTITARHASLGETQCDDPPLTETVEDTSVFFDNEYNLPPKNLGLPPRVTRVDAKCLILFPRQDGLVVERDGVFLLARRTNRGRT